MKILRAKMPDGTVWEIPAGVVAHNRATYYADKETNAAASRAVYMDEYNFTLANDDELADWAVNNMDWTMLEASAEQVDAAPEPDYSKLWNEAELSVVEGDEK